MTTAEIMQVLVQVGILLGIITTSIVTIIVALRTKEKVVDSIKKSDDNGKKADELLLKTEQIHTLTNSNLSKVTSALEVANNTIRGQQDTISRMTEEKVLAAGIAAKLAEKVPAPTAVDDVRIVNPPEEAVPITDTKGK